eukprot:Skav228980  [mRNA]  locus=scaffold671:277469:278212:- [translate_table: standard]
MTDEQGHRQTFPVKVLLGRLEQGATAPWSSYLPDHLRPKGVSAKVFEQSLAASAKAKAETKPAKKEYSPVGITVLGRVWEYSQDAAGCREVQHAIDIADEEIQLRIAAELQDHAACPGSGTLRAVHTPIMCCRNAFSHCIPDTRSLFSMS